VQQAVQQLLQQQLLGANSSTRQQQQHAALQLLQSCSKMPHNNRWRSSAGRPTAAATAPELATEAAAAHRTVTASVAEPQLPSADRLVQPQQQHQQQHQQPRAVSLAAAAALAARNRQLEGPAASSASAQQRSAPTCCCHLRPRAGSRSGNAASKQQHILLPHTSYLLHTPHQTIGHCCCCCCQTATNAACCSCRRVWQQQWQQHCLRPSGSTAG